MLAGYSQATVVFEADFNSPEYSLGGLGGQNGWSSFDGLQSVTTNGRGASEGLTFTGPSAGVFSNASQSFAGSFSQQLTASVDIFVDDDFVPSDASRGLRTGFGFILGNGSETTSVSYYLETASNSSGTNFDLVSIFVDDTPVAVEVVNLQRDQWSTLKVDYVASTGSLSFAFEGSLVHGNSGITGGTELHSIYGQLANFNGNAGEGIEVHHDNYVFESVPEPATMAIFGLGALAALRRKKSV